jgi:Fe-S-cluster containining protein
MECRAGCGACCIAPSISSPIPGLPQGKPAGLRCPHLSEDCRCGLWGGAAYPEVCRSFKPAPDACGSDREEALALLKALEEITRP